MTGEPLHPLSGYRVLEFGGIGPAPQAALQLADLGAELTTILPPGGRGSVGSAAHPARTVRQLDLTEPEGRAAALELLPTHDVLLEGFRPKTMERLGLAPEACAAVRPDLVYARLTGWGQSGPFASRAGHDINYIGLSGSLRAMCGADGVPVVPLNLVGDAGGGTMFAVVGILAALLRRERTGEGAVIDAAIVDGALQLSNLVWQLLGRGSWTPEPRSNSFDGGSPHYDVYRCADGEFMAVGALEEKFYREFLDVIGVDMADVPDREDRRQWPALRALFGQRIAEKTRDEWAALAEERDACFTPVLAWHEVAGHPHLAARGAMAGGLPAPAPRLKSLTRPIPADGTEPRTTRRCPTRS